MKLKLILFALILIAGCTASPTVESEYRQPWTVYKTRADIVPQVDSSIKRPYN